MRKRISEEDKINIGKKLYWEYRFLFDFPAAWKIFLANIGLIPILSLLLTSLMGELSIFSLIKAIVIVSFISILGGSLNSFLFARFSPKRKTVFKLNRSLAFSLGSSIGFWFLLMLSRSFSELNPYLGMGFETYALGLVMAVPLIIGYALTIDERFFGALWKSSIIPILIIIIDYFVYPSARVFRVPNPILLFILTFFFAGGVFLGVYIPLYLGKVGSDMNATNGLRGFFFSWFEKEHEYLEKELENMSFERYIPMGIVKIRREDNGKELLLITSYVHPGPLLDVGSSNLPYILLNTFLTKSGKYAFELHGTCSHGENLPSRNEVYKLIENLLEEEEKIHADKPISEVIQLKYEDFTYTVQIFGNYLMIIASRSPKDFDDIALGIGMEAYGKIRGMGFDGLLVDAHNSLSAPLAYIETKEGTENALRLLRGVDVVLEKIRELKFLDARGGWSQFRCPSIPINEGLGPGGVMAFIEEVNDKKFGLIILDANNLKAGLREKILDYLISKGLIDFGEVVTTDTHSVNAHSPRKGAYPLIDEEKLHKLLPCIEKVVKEALADMGPIKADGAVKIIKTKIIGRENIEKIVSASGMMVRLFFIMVTLFDFLVLFFNTVLLMLLV